MENAEKPVVNRTLYLVAFVVLAAALLLGITIYFDSIKQAAQARASAATDGSALAAQNGSIASGGAVQQPSGSAAAAGNVQQPANLTQNGAAQQAQNGTAAQSAQQAQQNATVAAKKEVTIDFLYADWCPHCQAMKPRVANVISQLPADRLEVRYWNDADRAKNTTVAAIYSDYMSKGMTGFPTFVSNGEMRAGEMPEADFKAWVCSQFSAPKPTGC